MRIELTTAAWEAAVLPLNYARSSLGTATPLHSRRQATPFGKNSATSLFRSSSDPGEAATRIGEGQGQYTTALAEKSSIFVPPDSYSSTKDIHVWRG